MKKILFLSSDGFPSSLNPHYGIFTFEQANALEKNIPILIDLQTNKSNSIYKDKYKTIEIHRLIYAKYNLLNIIKNLIYLSYIIKMHNPSLIICSFLNLRNIIFSIFFQIKKVTIIHGSDAVVNSFFKKMLFTFFLEKNHMIFTVSHYTKSILLKNFKSLLIKKKVKVVHNGISFKKFDDIDKNFEKKINNNKIIISCIANLVPRKNISFVVDIFEMINKKKPGQFQLIIVGTGSEEKKILNLITSKKLKKDILLFKNLSNAKISTIFHKSKYFFLFSKNFNHEFEGFGIVFIEAMYTGNIVFASKHGGITELIKNNLNGYIFDIKRKDNKQIVVNQFIKISKNENKILKILNYALKFSKKFSWNKNIKAVINNSL